MNFTNEPDELLSVLYRRGYVRCDVPACNCNGWHGGHAEARLGEIHDALEEAGIDLNGKTIRLGISEALSQRDELLALVREASEIMTITYAGNFPAGIESFLVRAAAVGGTSVSKDAGLG